MDNSTLLVNFKQRYTDPGLWDTVPGELKGTGAGLRPKRHSTADQELICRRRPPQG